MIIPSTNFFFVQADEHQELEDLRLMLKHPAGRRVFRRLLDKSEVMGVSYSANAASTEFNEGLRQVGLWLATKIETADPGGVYRLMQESCNDKLAEITKSNTRSAEDEC